MITDFFDTDTSTAVYINPTYVMSLRPDATDPHNVTLIKLSDGEELRVRGEHTEVADKFARSAAQVA